MTERKKTKVLVVEDSATSRMLLVHLLEADPQLRVIGAVADGQAALDFVEAQKPDVVLMDLHMPRLDGFEATRRLMERHAIPIVVCSAVSDVRDTAIAFRAMEAGAIACVEKPFARQDDGFEAQVAHLLQTVRLMSEVKVVRRRPAGRAHGATLPRHALPGAGCPRLVAIGASTGGPPVLQAILSGLPRGFPAPLLVVQHIAAGFLAGMAGWLAETSGMPVHIAAHGTLPLAGHVYLAPDDFHMGVDAAGRIVLSREPPLNYVRPAVSYLFRSVARHCGANAIAVLLTGMGRDGAEEMKLLRDAGAVTIAQDRQTSAVHGMPGAAIQAGGVAHVLPAERIAEFISHLLEPPA